MAHRTTLLRIVLLASVLVTASIGLSAQTKVVPPRNKYPLADDVRLGRDAAAQARKELPVMNDQVLTANVGEHCNDKNGYGSCMLHLIEQVPYGN